MNAEQLPNLEKIAQRGSPETTMQAMQAILEAREKITAYVTPLLAVEEMVLTLRASWGGRHRAALVDGSGLCRAIARRLYP